MITINKNIDTANLIEVADSSSIKLGKAYFTTVIKDDTKETFEINILKEEIHKYLKNNKKVISYKLDNLTIYASYFGYGSMNKVNLDMYK